MGLRRVEHDLVTKQQQQIQELTKPSDSEGQGILASAVHGVTKSWTE